MVRFLIFLAAAFVANAQQPSGTTPKANASEYPVHAQAGLNDLGAEYMVHSFSSGEQMFIAENYLVVEVALFPPKGESVRADIGKFSLRVNGKKSLPPENPGIVAGTLRHPDWQSPRGAQGGIGVGGIDIGLGGQRPRQSPYPGGQDPNRLPTPPRAPGNDSDTMREEKLKPEEVLVTTALPDGIHKGPVAGFLYFAWRGKASSIKTIDLVYGDTVLRLR
ncbi:MAG: hypothetical protein JWP63_4757 [Candidatus Solibacter sp.]|jgi:hypothetical protein|nr:hypothetical protein [Candidatus Solibacter sp.]